MKLAGAAAARYFARPEPDRAGLLIYGADAMRVALKRQQVIAALIGPLGEAEMRLTRMAAADLRKDPAALDDAVKARGFFPGPRVVFVEDATDGSAPPIAASLAEWQAGDAAIIVAAGALTPKSALRKQFEDHPNAYAVGIYDDPPTRDEIDSALTAAGLRDIGREAMTDLLALARDLDPGDFRQTVEKIGLYKHGDLTPLTADEVAACAPATIEADVDDLVHIVAEARVAELGPFLRRLQGQGIGPVTLCIGTTRHFRGLHAASAHAGGPAAGIGGLRPPVNFRNRDRMVRQAETWGMHRLEQALTILTDTDLALRSASRAPAMALMERALIRLAMLGGR
jgi:DNA polymerase-3 subunit delta